MVGRPREFDRDEALRGAMELFWEKGYDATGISELTEQLGIGRQSLYGCFGDKRGLFLEALEQYDRDVMDGILAMLRAPGDPIAAVRSLLDAWESHAKGDGYCGCLLANSMAELGVKDDEISQLLGRKLDRLESGFADALERAKADGLVRQSVDPRSLARQLAAMGQGLTLVAKVRRDPKALRDVVDGARLLLDASLA